MLSFGSKKTLVDLYELDMVDLGVILGIDWYLLVLNRLIGLSLSSLVNWLLNEMVVN